ncbi:1,2-phenylacetyl-CoA epoxidase subunit PaaD [Salinisphaera orenii]|uniref:Phenylacetic acid degradation protein n=1 Tax=Salinisphaera orenii YIM 95161 TaxID=1051139 RepID=A0A423PUS3_9GAMM|nr:1,2-phenylacetyl-CoA epoxidase subunit PaaD [Salinisphaera halophila]ROO29343.1 phenylacetic acid degradation protein [Salinisphaera halophila YIM 95161]
MSVTEQTRFETHDVWQWLDAVPDPEIPVVSVIDLGIVRDVRFEDDQLVVTITPTYSGCPAMQVIEDNILGALREHGVEDARLDVQLSPAWTTDWMSERGKENLRGYGIAPPGETGGAQVIDISRITRNGRNVVPQTCPHCGSKHTERVSEFGSTPCKALHRCLDCQEPFDYFKPF